MIYALYTKTPKNSLVLITTYTNEKHAQTAKKTYENRLQFGHITIIPTQQEQTK